MNYIERIITKQCEAIGIPRDAVDPYNKGGSWYSEYSWTREMQDGFVDWLSNELYNDNEFRKAIMFPTRKTKKTCIDCAKQWVFMYGWKVGE